MCFVNGKFGYRKPKINCSFVLILGKREGVKKDSKMSLLGKPSIKKKSINKDIRLKGGRGSI